MPDPTRQLVLDLPVEPRFGAEDFLVGPSNAAAHGLIEAWPDWPGQLLRLQGPSGSGKSHLAAIWAARAGAGTVDAADVTAARVPGLADAQALVVEDFDRGRQDEPALFHLLNLARERGTFVLLTSAASPRADGIETPDLLSRLRLAPVATLGPPDDALLRAVLVKLFHDRQIQIDASVVDFVAARIGRSLADVGAAVAALDHEALSQGRRVTRPVAAAVLAAADAIAESDG